MAEDRDIKYLNKTFSDFRTNLIELAKNYFPDTYNDFSQNSPGMMFIEMASYVGDVLSFYQDTQLQETFLQYAKDPANLYDLAYSMGYRPKVTSTSEVEVEITQRVDGVSNQPDYNQAFYIPEYSTLRSSAGGSTQFLLKESIDFATSSSYQPTPEPISFDGSGNITEFLLRRKATALSGEIITLQETFGVSQKFSTIDIEDDNIIGVLDITDSEGNKWYEVPYLGQETIFDEQLNNLRGEVSKDLILRKTPRRFTTRFKSSNILQLQFGSGIISGSADSTFIPNPSNVGMKTGNGITRLDTTYDPSNFLFTNTYGLAPSNTVLTIRYLKGGGVQSNVPANTVTVQGTVNPISFGGDDSKLNTLTFNNPFPATGGRDGDTVDELRLNTSRAFNEQGRAVTLQDYQIRTLSLPSRFGNISKVFASNNSTPPSLVESNKITPDFSSINLYLLSKDFNGKLINTSTPVKSNLKKYLSQFSMLTDSISFQDAFIVNIGLEFEITVLPGFLGRDILLSVRNELTNYFNIDKWNINQPINLSKLYTFVDRIKGVQSLRNIVVTNKVGTVNTGNTVYNYSEYGYDIKSATRDNIVYPSVDPCIFEIKYPEVDIKGRIVTL